MMMRAIPSYELRDDGDNILLRTKKRRLLKLGLQRLPMEVSRVTVRRATSRGSLVDRLSRRDDGRWLLERTFVTYWSQLPPEALNLLAGKPGKVRQVAVEGPPEHDICKSLAEPAVRAGLASAGFEVITLPEADPADTQALLEALSRKRVYC